MSFQLRRKVLEEALKDGIESIRIIPYYNSGVCLKIYKDRYELWNYETIPTSTVAKVIEMFIQNEVPTLKELYIKDLIFKVPKDNVRENLFNFLTEIEKSKLNEQ